MSTYFKNNGSDLNFKCDGCGTSDNFVEMAGPLGDWCSSCQGVHPKYLEIKATQDKFEDIFSESFADCKDEDDSSVNEAIGKFMSGLFKEFG